MNALKCFWKNLASLWSLVVGLKVTGKAFVGPQVTVHYPRQTVGAAGLEGYRGHMELVPSPKNPAIPKCISCMMCATSCPSKCITITKQKEPKPTEEQLKAMAEAEARGEKVKKPTAPKNPASFTYDFSLCSFCNTCADNCPVGSIRFSTNVYFAVADRKDLKMDLLARLARQASEAKPGDKAAGGAAAPDKPKKAAAQAAPSEA